MKSMKIRNPLDIFEELGIVLEYGYGRFKDRNVRFIDSLGLFEVGECDKDFDRWSNSVEFQFEVWQKKGQRQFLRWVNGA